MRTTAVDRLRTATVAVLFAAAVLVPFALILLHHNIGDGNGAAQAHPVLPTTAHGSTDRPAPVAQQPPTRPGGLHLNLSILLLVLALVAAAAALAAAIVLALRLLRDTPPQGAVAGEPPAPDSGLEDEALADALLAGRSALEGDDARAAIIACYAAMESSLARAGIARERADSPSDLLRRATARDVVDRPAAAALTDLFREARYSTHPMDGGHLAAARRALDAITESITDALARRAEAVAAQ